LGVSEGRLCMKEPQVGILCPEIRELDGDFGDKLGWSFFLVGHDARMYHLKFKVLRKSQNWIAFNCMFKVGGHQYRGCESDSNENA